MKLVAFLASAAFFTSIDGFSALPSFTSFSSSSASSKSSPLTRGLFSASTSPEATTSTSSGSVFSSSSTENHAETSTLPPFNSRLHDAFTKSKSENKAAFISFVTGGYPNKAATVPLLLSLQKSGSSVIELGVPYTDPQADGPVIQLANNVALKDGTKSVDDCLKLVKQARLEGLTVPVILMGYYNPFYKYPGSFSALAKNSKESGVDGFIVVDLPPEEGNVFVKALAKESLSYVPLIAPTTTEARMKFLVESASSFVYCVSKAGVTGGVKNSLPLDLKNFVSRVRKYTDLPLAVGFGVTDTDQVAQIASISDGVVVGSAILAAVDKPGLEGTIEQRCTSVESYVSGLVKGTKQTADKINECSVVSKYPDLKESKVIDASRFGDFGGQFIPETLAEAFREIETEYNKIKVDPEFIAEVARYRKDFVGGPTPLHLAPRLTEMANGANIWLKREDLAHTGAHKINNAIGQALLAKRLGKNRIIAETGAGQHGVATATVCAMLGMECIVYMGAVDVERQKLNVFKMKCLGATVVPVQTGQRTLKDAINEAFRDWVTNVVTTHYLIGSAVGAHPFPTIVRDFQSVIGKEIKSQFLEKTGKLPDAIVACVGGGSNAIGSFHPFINDPGVKMFGAEAAGKGLHVEEGHCATLSKGTMGVLQGAMTYIIQSEGGQSSKSSSISAGLDYVGVGPEHAWLAATKRAEYSSVTDDECLAGFDLLCMKEGIIPALETSHAVWLAIEKAKTMPKGSDLVITLSGRGDKDLPQIAKIRGLSVAV